MAQRQPIRQRADTGFPPRLEPANQQQQKVLLRLKPSLASGCVAFLQKPSYKVTKL
jgi:hypothetical protein